MFLLRNTVSLCCLLSIVSLGSPVLAQTNTDSLEAENITFTGESLQGISSENSEPDYGYQDNSQLEITLERQQQEQTGTGNELVDTLINSATGSLSPTYTIDKLNTNQGDTSNSGSGTIPLANF